MGNRAVITTKKNWENDGVGVYLHWNGGRDSVGAFLKYCELKGYRSPSCDNYGWARLCQVIGNFFGGDSSIGIDTLWHLDRDNGDNGVYIIEGWEIVGRIYEQNEQEEYDLLEMLTAINDAMPESERLPRPLLSAEEVFPDELSIGDYVYVRKYGGDYVLSEVVDIIDETPVVNAYENQGEHLNPNNKLISGKYRRVAKAGDLNA